jgi:hypothetical protein
MNASAPRSAPSSIATPAIVLALVLLAGLAMGGAAMLSMGRIAPGTQIPPDALTAQGDTPTSPADVQAPPPGLASGPGWEVMTTPQKLALYPLAERWAHLSEAQKRYWLALAQNFATMPEQEQERLHARMTAWASLSAQQRSQARLNFAVTRSLAPLDIRSEWETYQALSEADKKRLAAKAPKPRGAATALKPVPARRLAQVPAATGPQAREANPPKIVFPAPAPVRLPPPPEPVALPPSAPASSSDNGGSAPVPAAQDAPGAPASTDPLPPVYVN